MTGLRALCLLALAACEPSNNLLPTPPVPTQLNAVSALTLQDTASRTIPTPMVVVVLDQNGEPLQGQMVRWTAGAGGGSVMPDSVLTGADGRASASWTLPDQPGTWTLRAESGDLTPVLFTAQAHAAPVQIVAPAHDRRVGDDLQLHVVVTSPDETVEVTAIVADRVAALAAAADGWRGSLSLAGLPGGPHVVRVTARRASGVIGVDSVRVIRDLLPAVQVGSPVHGQVARPGIRLIASCHDDHPAGCASMLVRANGVQVGQVIGGSLDMDLSLAAYDGQRVTLEVTGVDSAGQWGTTGRTVYVESSPRWTEVASAGTSVMDFDGGRLLYLDGPALRFRTGATGGVATIQEEGGRPVQYGFLAPHGAIFVEATGALDARVMDWRGGAAVALGTPDGLNSLRVAGSWALWSEGERLLLRDLVAGTSQTVSHAAGNSENGVAANGDVVYWNTLLDVRRWRGGTETAISDPADSLWSSYPITDGVNVVYRRHSPCCAQQRYQIILLEGDGTLTPLTGMGSAEPSPRRSYAVSNGWVAFTRPGPSGVQQVWLRSPGGAEAQVTASSSESSIVSLGPDGSLVIQTGSRWLAGHPGGALVDVGNDWPRDRGEQEPPIRWVGTHAYILLGRSVFRLDF